MPEDHEGAVGQVGEAHKPEAPPFPHQGRLLQSQGPRCPTREL